METDPTKHADQVHKNWKKNFDDECTVWFIVYTEKHKEYIVKVLNEHDVPPSGYFITVVDKDLILTQDELPLDAPVQNIAFSGSLTETGLVKTRDGVPQNLPEMTTFEFAVYMALLDTSTTVDIVKKKIGKVAEQPDFDVKLDKAVRSMQKKNIVQVTDGEIRKVEEVAMRMKAWGDAGKLVVRYTRAELEDMEDVRVIDMFNSPHTNPKTREMIKSILKKRGWKF